LTSKSSNELVNWLRGNIIALFTILGVSLFVIFSIPATIFYNLLGTTPSEVGITYSTILSGSTLGAAALVGTVLAIGAWIIYMASSIIINIAVILVFGWAFYNKIINDVQFEEHIVVLKNRFGRNATLWDEIEEEIRHWRQLDEMTQPTKLQKKERRCVRAQIQKKIGQYLIFHVRHFFLSGRRYIFCAIAVIIAATAFLALTAQSDAQSVIKGTSGSIGEKLQLFDYHATSVKIFPSTSGGVKAITMLSGRKLYLLGQNSQDLIFYVPYQHSTIRVPISAVIVTELVQP
jgi:hypothetical protein